MCKLLPNVALPVVFPHNCVVAVGLPSSQASFDHSAEASADAYASQFIGGWAQYRVQWMQPLEHFSRVFRSLGVVFLPDVTLESLAESFADPAVSAIVLVSHWGDSAIELANGFVSVDQVVEIVPIDFKGVFDLCVCHPNGLATELGRHRPNCLVRFTPKSVRPLWWLAYFEGFFQMLSTGKLNYLQAFEALNLELAKRIKLK